MTQIESVDIVTLLMHIITLSRIRTKIACIAMMPVGMRVDYRNAD